MKNICLLIIFLITQSVFSQKSVDTTYHINRIIGMDMADTKKFTLQKIDMTNSDFVYGNTITFNNRESTFNCNYSAPCGNDCFPYSNGTFKRIDESHVELFVKQFGQDGDCEKKKVELNTNLGIYIIVKDTEYVLKLVKQ